MIGNIASKIGYHPLYKNCYGKGYSFGAWYYFIGGKHFIMDCSISSLDATFSMEKEEFAAMVKAIRNVEKALGEVVYPTDPSKIKGREFCRSLYVAEDVKAGDVITEKNVRSVRPGFGLHPKYLPEILGKRVNGNLEKGTRFSLDLVK